MYNRRFRHAFKQFLIIADDSKPEPSLRELSNPWSMDKDGKNRFDPSEFPYLLWKQSLLQAVRFRDHILDRKSICSKDIVRRG